MIETGFSFDLDLTDEEQEEYNRIAFVTSSETYEIFEQEMLQFFLSCIQRRPSSAIRLETGQGDPNLEQPENCSECGEPFVQSVRGGYAVFGTPGTETAITGSNLFCSFSCMKNWINS